MDDSRNIFRKIRICPVSWLDFMQKGLEGAGVGGCYKHFIGNNCESSRKRNQSLISERAIREIYFRTFEYAMDVHMPASFMTAYNAVNGCRQQRMKNFYRGFSEKKMGLPVL